VNEKSVLSNQQPPISGCELMNGGFYFPNGELKRIVYIQNIETQVNLYQVRQRKTIICEHGQGNSTSG
jgi:hypothetical protein